MCSLSHCHQWKAFWRSPSQWNYHVHWISSVSLDTWTPEQWMHRAVFPSVTDIHHCQDHPSHITLIIQKSCVLEDLNSNHIVFPLCRYDTPMSECIPHMNSMQSTVLPKALACIHFISLAYAQEQIWPPTSHIYVPLHYFCGLHIDPTLLHIKERINNKICNLVQKLLHGKALQYLQDVINFMRTKWPGLRPELKEMQLDIPPNKRKTFASRSFSVYGPTFWNSLPTTYEPAQAMINSEGYSNPSIQLGIQLNASLLSASHNGNISWGLYPIQ